MPHRTVPYRATLCHTVPYRCAIPCHTVPYRVQAGGRLCHDLGADEKHWNVDVGGLSTNAAAMLMQAALTDLRDAQVTGALHGLPTLFVHTGAAQQAQVQVRGVCRVCRVCRVWGGGGFARGGVWRCTHRPVAPNQLCLGVAVFPALYLVLVLVLSLSLQVLLKSLRPPLRSHPTAAPGAPEDAPAPPASAPAPTGSCLAVKQEDLMEYLTAWATGAEDDDEGDADFGIGDSLFA